MHAGTHQEQTHILILNSWVLTLRRKYNSSYGVQEQNKINTLVMCKWPLKYLDFSSL